MQPHFGLTTGRRHPRMSDKLLCVEVIPYIFGHHLHHVVVRSFDNHPLLIIPNAQQRHKSHGRSCAVTPTGAAHSFGERYLGTSHSRHPRLYIGLDLSDLTPTRRLVIFPKNHGQHGLFLLNTTDDILLLRDLMETFLDHLHDLIRMLQRAARMHRDIDIEAVGLNFPVLTDVHRQRQNQRQEKQYDGAQQGGTGMTHARFEKHEVNLHRPLQQRNLFVKYALTFSSQDAVGCHRNKQQGHPHRHQQGGNN